MASSIHLQSELQRKITDHGVSLKFENAFSSNSASEVSADRANYAPLEIRTFLKDKSILITGATGFLGKVLVEKLLRTQSEINQLYLLVQPRGGLSPEQRVQSEILDVELFKVLRSKLGHEFEQFTKKKITVVSGNVRSPDLGISSGHITPNLDLIMHVAGNTKWDERFDVSVQDNAVGPTTVMKFAKTCPKLKLFLHVSTASVNTASRRKGFVTEKPLKMGETMVELLAKETDESRPSDRDIPRLDVNFETELAENAADCGSSVEKEMVEFGRRRAQLFGWQDVYAFTKAMGEMLLFENRGHIPLAVVRPPGVVSTYKEPFPGWIEGFKVVDPIAVPYGLGQFTGFTASENSMLYLIPVDMVVNTILAVAAKHYGREQQDAFVYHSFSSSSVNPFTLKGFGDAVYKHFKAHPMVDKHGNDILVEKFRCFEDADEFKRSVRSRLLAAALVRLYSEEGSNSDMEEVLQRVYAKLRSDYGKLLKRIELLWTYTHHFTSYDNHNAETLHRQICQDEQEIFGYGIAEVDWINFLAEVHLPGLRRHVLKERPIQRLN